MRDFDGRVVAITGAGSGIGRALARAFVQRGAHLSLSDIDAEGLADTVTMCEGHGVTVTSHLVDVADRAAVEGWASATEAEHGAAHVIVNNAGVALGATTEAMTYDDFEWLMDINFWGVVYGTKAFLPLLKRADEGHVVNLSSVFGLVSIPSQSAYNAAKFGVRGFSDALRIELDIEGSHVSVTTVHPGGIKTNIARSARIDPSLHEHRGDIVDFADEFEKMAHTSPEKAARQIIRAVERNRRRALVGPDAKLFDLASRLPAGLYQRLLVASGRRERDRVAHHRRG